MTTLTTLEIILIVLTAIMTYLLFHFARAYIAVRYGYIQMSDWCAQKLDEVIVSAKWMAEDTLAKRGNTSPTDKDIEMLVRTDIIEAKQEWEKELNRQMDMLKRNGVPHLNSEDNQTILLSWLK